MPLSVCREREKLPGERRFIPSPPGNAAIQRQVRLAGFFDQLFRPQERRQMFGDAIQRRRALMPGADFFRAFELLPLREDGFGGVDFFLAKDVRVTANELVHDVAADGVEIKRAALAGELAVKDDLQEEVAEFLDHLVIVVGFDGIEQLIDFFDGVEAQGHVVLFAVPGAAGRGTKPGHDGEEVIDRGRRFHVFR